MMNSLLMIRPVRFAYNAQTAVNNAFQSRNPDGEDINRFAQQEFDTFTGRLLQHDIEVLVLQDTEVPHTPDSIFPNNWVSFHENGKIILYPRFAENRRWERKDHGLQHLHELFAIRETLDYTHYENDNRYLEGTGSFVLDRPNKIAYACTSPRTDPDLFVLLCKKIGYKAVLFDAFDSKGQAIYHTNVMMCVADRYVVINMESIPVLQAKKVAEHITATGKHIIPITHRQMEHFAGNMLQLTNKEGICYLVMSTQAWQSLTQEQQNTLHNYNPIIHSALDTIEKHGGGSARCMMAEIYLEKKEIIDNGRKI
ncbi:MAG TPA: arginine deiminase-related protein [Sphingobacterium sp.]|nr:arginine deiminase-related protein [Sphingobacterium sp.]